MTRPVDLIIFDLDGVITTEQIYWECARLTLWELVQPEQVASAFAAIPEGVARERILPPVLIDAVKDRAVNSNWDLTYLAACALLLACEPGDGTKPETILGLLGQLRSGSANLVAWPAPIERLLGLAGERQSSALLDFAGRAAADHVGAPRDLLQPQGAWWSYLYERFQRWLSGEMLVASGMQPLVDTLTLPAEILQGTLRILREKGYLLGIATGRPYAEAIPPLHSNGLLDLLDPYRIVTHSDVETASKETGQTALGKPHPFSIWRAMFPELPTSRLLGMSLPGGLRALMVGDSPSDARAAQAAGIPCVGVLSGLTDLQRRERRRVALRAAGCVDVLPDVSHLPAWLDSWH